MWWIVLAAAAVQPRLDYEVAYTAGGDWYRDATNDDALLAWGESYVMRSLVAMYERTRDRRYLDRLAWHADGVLANRDSARGVVDYRGVSAECWQNTGYQPAGEAYCYGVHTGIIAEPIVQFARLVSRDGLGDEVAWDGQTFAAKAAAYTAAGEAAVAAHADQWDPAGFYVFRPDAVFLGYPGRDVPLNQSNTLGRLLLVLHDVTADPAYLDQATALAARFHDQLTLEPDGAYRWNYWGGPYVAPGEDVSHAAINVDFAAMAAERGVVFDADDLAAFATTFEGAVLDDGDSYDFIGGGSISSPGYRPQLGRWLAVSPDRPGVYAAVRNQFDAEVDPGSVSGSVLLGLANLARYEPPHCAPFLYYVDWAADGDWWEATAYGANVLTTPPDLAAPCIVPLEVELPRTTTFEQWDGAAYHPVATLAPTDGPTTRFVPYDPRWPHVYWADGVLFQLTDAFVDGDGPRVRDPVPFVPPSIVSEPPAWGVDAADYAPVADGDAPHWWSLVDAPVGARIDPLTGVLDHVPAGPGDSSWVVAVENHAGRAEQAFDQRICGRFALPTDGAANVGTLTVDAVAVVGGALEVTVAGLPDGDAQVLVSTGGAALARFGGTVVVDPAAVVARVPVAVVDGAGSAVLPVPGDPSLAGRSVRLQAAMRDADAPEGWWLTDGVEVGICP